MVAIGIGKHITTVLEQGREEARTDGAGLDHETVRVVLRREFEHSLRAAGVTDLTRGLPPPSPSPRRPTQIGASAKSAIERGVRAAGRAEFRPGHLLMGIVRAEAGTVPRALRLAGIDPVELERRVVVELGAEPLR
jgi:hypothetical protein